MSIFRNSFIQPARHHGPIALMYHMITQRTGTTNWPWAISLKHFRDHLDFLAKYNFKTVTISEMTTHSARLPDKCVAITFDDGYVDNLLAWEELASRGMCATWYIITGAIGKKPKMTNDTPQPERLLNSNEIREMAASGMEIGSHTVNHVRLPQITSATRDIELKDSKSHLEDILGHEVSSFAYPFGVWNEDCEQAVRKTGFTSACTTRSGWALKDANPFRIRRISIFNNDSSGILGRKILLGTNDGSRRALFSYYTRRLISRLPNASS